MNGDFGMIVLNSMLNGTKKAVMLKNAVIILRQYHARGKAHFAVNKWSDPILLKADGRTVKDGTHRLKAAIYLDLDAVEVEITDDPA